MSVLLFEFDIHNEIIKFKTEKTMSTRRRTLKITAIAAIVLTLGVLASVICSSLTLTGYTVGDVYKKSHYYKAVTDLELTGDQRYDVISIALSQVGYHTGDSDGEMHGKNIRGWNGFVEYNRIYGKVDNNQGNGVSYGYYWCTCFVSWCMRQAGVPTDMVPTKCACRHILSHLDSKGLYAKATSGYIPTCGDLIFFRNANSSNVTHIGFVLGVKDNMVYTVEGNANDHVTTRSHPLNDTYIEGYGKVKYKTIKGMSYDFALATTEELYFPYTYSKEIKVYSQPGTKNSVIYTIPANTVFDIYQIKSSWVKVNTPNGYGWCDITNADPVLPNPAYAIKYYLGGGVGGNLDQISYEGEAITLCKTAPVRNGYTFKGWAEAPNGQVKYHPGDTYKGKKGDSLKELFAVWEADTYNVKYLDEDGNVILDKTVEYGNKTPAASAPAKEADETYRYKFKSWSPAVSPLVFGDAVYTPVYTSEKLVPDTTTAEETTKAPETDPPRTDAPATDAPAEDTETVTVTDTVTDEITEDMEATDSEAYTEESVDSSSDSTTTDSVTSSPDDVTTDSADTTVYAQGDDNNNILAIAAGVMAAAAVVTTGVIFAVKRKNG